MSWPPSQLPQLQEPSPGLSQPQGSKQLPWLTIAECYKELLVNPNLIQLFPANEWMSFNELPCLHVFYFCVVSEGLYTKLFTPEGWCQTVDDFITHFSKKVRNKEIALMAILITDGVGEEKLGMVTAFCHSNQAGWSLWSCFWSLLSRTHRSQLYWWWNLHQFTIFQWGSSAFPFLNIATLPMGTSTIQFPFSWLCLHSLILWFPTQVILSKEEADAYELKVPQSQQRHCGRVPLRNTVYHPWCCCHCCSWSKIHISALTRVGTCRPTKD